MLWDSIGVHRGNPKLFYRVLQGLRTCKQVKNTYIKSKEGKVIDDKDDKMARWKKYFDDLHRTEIIDRLNNAYKVNELYIESKIYTEDKIITEEVVDTVLKIDNALGINGLTSERAQNMVGTGIPVLKLLFKKIWAEQKIRADQEIWKIVPMSKKETISCIKTIEEPLIVHYVKGIRKNAWKQILKNNKWNTTRRIVEWI